LLQRAHSKSGLQAANAYNYSFHLNPGARLLLMGREWLNAETDFDFTWLNLKNMPEDKELIDDLNYVLVQGETYMKQQKVRNDLSCLALEVDSKKLHLA
jgi:hypothetical protein